MSGKPKNTKAPKAEEPLDDEFPEEEFEEQPVVTAAADDSRKYDKSRAPAEKKKKSRRFKLSSVDPIILASFSIFMIACLIVTGITVYGIVAGDSNNKAAEYGDSVEVEYTGSYFAYYDETGAVIFDTNMKDVGEDNDKYPKSGDYTKKDSYSVMSMTVGQGQLLDEFKNALIGHKPGDIVKVEIKDGYGKLTLGQDYFKGQSTAGLTVDKAKIFSADEYKSFFGVDDIPGAGITTVKSPYGWDAQVSKNTNGTVNVLYTPTLNEEKEVCTGLKAKATADDGTTITFTYIIDGDAFYYDDPDHPDSKMLKAYMNNKTVYIIAYNGTDSFDYKTTAENVGTTMYFTIKFVGYASSSS